VKPKINIGFHERTAQTEVFHATVGTRKGIRRHLDRDIDFDPLTPAPFFSVPSVCHGNYLLV
jgi:hypothetical protein